MFAFAVKYQTDLQVDKSADILIQDHSSVDQLKGQECVSNRNQSTESQVSGKSPVGSLRESITQWIEIGANEYIVNTPGNVKNRFDLELFGRSEINTIYTSLHEHSQNHPILLSLHFHSELLECLQHFGTPRDHFRSVNWPVGGHLVLKFRG